MNPRATALLALVVALLGAGVWWFEVRGADRRAEREEAEKRIFPGFEESEVDWIELETSDAGSARLERKDGVWRLVAPLDFPADDAAAGGLASSLTRVLREAAYDDPAPLAEYGLTDEPQVSFGVGDATHALRIGSASPVGGNTYVATAADAPVYAVASYRVAGLTKKLEDLREKRILRFERDRVSELKVAWPDGGVRLVRELVGDATAPWRVVEPLEDAADPRAVDALLSDLEFLRAAAFREGGDAPEHDPALSAEIVVQTDDGPETLRVSIGEAVVQGRREVRGPLAGAGYLVAEARLDDFPRRVDAYRDRTLASFVTSDAQRLELLFHAEGSGESHAVSAERAEGGEWSSEPERVDPVKLQRLVGELARLEGERIAAESAGEVELAGLGLEPPRVALRVLGEGGDEAAVLAEVQLGVGDAGRGIAARRPDREILYWLPWTLAEHLPVSLDALRNRFLIDESPAPPESPTDAE